MQTVWEVLTATSTRRTYQPVRRDSRLRGREGIFWQPFDKTQAGRMMTAAERYERATRAKGQRSGRLGSVALEVLREMLRLVDYRTGRLEPSMQTLCERLRRSKDAVWRALRNLRGAGFLDWIRRYEPTGEQGRGVQVKQTSNAYRLALPPAAAKLLGRRAEPAPLPADEEQRQSERKADHAAMIARLPLEDQAGEIVDDKQLAAVLSRIGKVIAERESAERAESHHKFNYNERP